MKKRIIAAVTMLAMFTGTAVAANNYNKTIEVEYGIKLSVDGRTPMLTDVTGKTVQPFVYDGTTYIPLRSIANLFSAYTEYDEASNTASITQYTPPNLELAKYAVQIQNISHQAHEIVLEAKHLIESSDMKPEQLVAFRDKKEALSEVAIELAKQCPLENETAVQLNNVCSDQFQEMYKAAYQCVLYIDTPSSQNYQDFYSTATTELQKFNSVQAMSVSIINDYLK